MRRILIVLFVLALVFGASPSVSAQGGDDGSRGDPGPINPGANPGVQILPDPPVAGCVDANLQTSAMATTSGGGSGGSFGPQLANDGIFGAGGEAPTSCGIGSWNWILAGMYPTASWYQLEWAAPVNVGQIWVDTKPLPSECGAGTNRALHAADIQTWDGAAWVDHGAVTAQTDDWGFVIPGGPVSTTRVRLNRLGVWDASSQDSNPILYELKVYDCQVVVPPPPPPPPAAAVGGEAIGQVETVGQQAAAETSDGGTGRLTLLLGLAVGLLLLGTAVWGGRRVRA